MLRRSWTLQLSSDISDESAVITLEVELVSTTRGADKDGVAPEPFLPGIPDDIFDVVKELVDDEINESIGDALEDEGIDTDTIKNLTQNLKDLDNKALGNVSSFAKNPEAFMSNTFMTALKKAGPYGALTVAIIAAVLGTPELVKGMVQMFGVKGGFLNQDFRYSQEEQLSQEFSRIMQFQRLTGDNPVIRFDDYGFVAISDPDFQGNSLVDANEARSARIGLRESAYGYIHGI